MLAAMPPAPHRTPKPGEPVIRDRGDACPGALRLHTADDGRLARLRLPAGRLTSRQIGILADAAETLGDGHLGITSRGNAELRGLGDGCGTELAGRLADAGLLPSPSHERVRNIVASPAAGLDGLGHGDVGSWARELDALLCAADWAAGLSGRFLFVLDDGRGDVAGLGGDVTLVAAPPESGAPGRPGAGDALLHLAGRAVRVTAADAPRAALAAARAFLAAARAAGTGAWRVGELPPGHAPDLAGHLAAAGIPAAPAGGAVLPAGPPPEPGLLGDTALYALAPLGRLPADRLRALLPAAEVRLTPWRGAVVTGLPGRSAALARLRALAGAGLITEPASPWAGVGACTGRPGCGKALADVRADATPGAAGPTGPGPLPGGADPAEAGGTAAGSRLLPVHFSGCDRRCGHPHGAWVDVVATPDGHYEVDGAPTSRAELPGVVAAARRAGARPRVRTRGLPGRAPSPRTTR
ncbi:cobalamin biosynthesis protein CobG [Streptomyces sp. LP05-1]|uniref:Cobalamin biosynthesis protein CobG n=1 Tax=Streptomyces pyxinae TaxID=2970734 RepID=A0ABT2CCG3_9ACTN|nr:cobalamin biosynthesis protein CobG [Streptomyces sp. LP05-1]MCS0635084.1 cobalamin biosynthesis protein CobG [Streptomyces sp. LP05-1]